MRNLLRTLFVCLLIVMLVYSPVIACHSCGGGGYYSYGPVYHSSYDDGGGCCGCGGYEVVYDSYDGCGSCDPCNTCDGAVIESAPVEIVEPGVSADVEPMPLQEPAQVGRPVDVAPALPPMPPPPTPPAPTEAVPPSEPGDLFDAPATTPPAETPAAIPPAEAPPATPPAPDDLFGAPAETPAPAEAPAETPAATPPTETPPLPTPPAPTDDLFGTDSVPAETPPAAEPPAETPPAEGTPPAATPPAEAPAGEEKADDIFGASPNVLREAGGLASNELRLWTDNTGNFACRGRLIRFLNGQVQLAKDNGRTTTVPLSRLSAGDLKFVERQASAQQSEIFQTAQAN